MRLFKFLAWICFTYQVSISQNLVVNGNFDTLVGCPNNQGQLTIASPWISARGTCDLYNSCNTGDYSTPSNLVGTQNPRSGNGYAGFFAAQGSWTIEVREYLHAQLRSPLIAGHNYCITFYVSLSDQQNSWGDYDSDMAVNDLAAYFSNSGIVPDPWDFAHLPVTPQIINPSSNQLSDRNNWMPVSGSFTATGGEQFITIGSFSSNANQDTTELDFWQSNKTSYYYIDDVSLIDCSAPLPLTVNVNGSTSVCEGGTISLTASGSGGTPTYQYNWNGAGFTTNSTFTTTATNNATYSVEIKDASGTTNTTSYTVSVIPLPNGYVVTDTTVCENSFVTLTASGGSSYEWHDGFFGTVQTTTPDIILEVISDMDMIVGISDGTCIDLDTVNIHTIPSPPIIVSNDTSICSGQNVALEVNGIGSYLWETGSTDGTITVQPTSTTNYWVTVSNATCSSRDSITVTVNQVPNANAGNDIEICYGGGASITAQGGTTYQWNDGSSTQMINVNPLIDTDYIVIVSNGNCSDKDTVSVLVNPLPYINVSNNPTICNGGYTTLIASGSGNVFSWASLQTYSWSTNPNNDTVLVNPSSTTDFAVSISNGSCTNSDTVKVTVLPIPTINLGLDKLICEGQTITLNATSVNAIMWSTGVTGSSINVSPITNSVYYATASNGFCNFTDTIRVNVTPFPVANAGADISICEGQEATLTGSGGGSYLWNTNSSNPSILILPIVTSNYILTVSNGTCSDKDTVKVTVLPKDVSPCAEVISIIEIPNIFTPNGDGSNDLFFIRIFEVSEFTIEIYNRWGSLITSFDKNNPYWDGRLSNGEMANQGTYYYLLQGIGNDKKIYKLKGFFELIR